MRPPDIPLEAPLLIPTSGGALLTDLWRPRLPDRPSWRRPSPIDHWRHPYRHTSELKPSRQTSGGTLSTDPWRRPSPTDLWRRPPSRPLEAPSRPLEAPSRRTFGSALPTPGGALSTDLWKRSPDLWRRLLDGALKVPSRWTSGVALPIDLWRRPPDRSLEAPSRPFHGRRSSK